MQPFAKQLLLLLAMLLIGNTIVSEELLQEEFVCNLKACRGACCVEGDSGAPLAEDELQLIENALPAVKKYLSRASLKLMEDKGWWEKDRDGDLVTNCHNGADCVFAIHENGIYACGMEKAFLAGETVFRKPASCYLYPIRITRLSNGLEALNYSRWDICSSACTLGKELKMPIYRFLKLPLLERYGQEWYDELEDVAADWRAAYSIGTNNVG